MESSLWQRDQALFEDLVALPANARGPFLDEQCGNDETLRSTLDSMLASADAKDNVLVSPIASGEETALPRVLGDFELLEEIGRGGMGVVYRARQSSLRREVAVKVLPQWWFQSPRQIQRFQRESRAGGRLTHPGIVTVYAEGKVDDVHYFAMEFLGGPTLDQLIKERSSAERGRWAQESRALADTAGIARLMAGVAEALDAAHGAGIIHRDVKPSNLIMALGGFLKLGDFGLVLDDRAASMSLTGEVLGSPHYMSPEQAGGESDSVDHRTDLYSLGVVMYELLTGQRPYAGDNVVEVLRDVVDAAPRSIRSLQPKVPHDLAIICEVAMAKRPIERYSTAADLAADLRRALALEPIHARAIPRSRRVARWARRHRAPLWTAAAAVGAAMALGHLYLEQSLQLKIIRHLKTIEREAVLIAPEN